MGHEVLSDACGLCGPLHLHSLVLVLLLLEERVFVGPPASLGDLGLHVVNGDAEVSALQQSVRVQHNVLRSTENAVS